MTGSKMLAVICVILAFSTRSILGWEAEQMEVFDLVEELNNLNFYKFLDVSPSRQRNSRDITLKMDFAKSPKRRLTTIDADISENHSCDIAIRESLHTYMEANSSTIRQAFRRMSLQLHPDKNDAPDAEVRFRELVSIHDVLRDPKKRAHYDKVLKEGLPDWHHALYYYRRVRKMGFLEMLVILFSIISVGQYLVAWGSYIENKITVEELLSSKVRKLRKQKKYRGDSTLPPEFDVNIPKPSLKDTLPCQIPYWLWIFVLNLPSLTTSAISFLVTKFKERTTCESNEEPEKPEPIVRERVRRRKVQYKIPEINEYKNTVVENRAKTNLDKSEPPVVSGGLWTDDDLYELSQMVNKYPAGTSDRWQKVAKAMHRPVPEVAYMANKMKENGYKVPTPGETQESVVTEEPKKIKTRSTTNTESTDSAWNQVQQKALESALTKYPKGSTENRWEKIAKCVPNKTKEECMARFKEVVQMVKKKNNSTDEPLENGDVGTTE